MALLGSGHSSLEMTCGRPLCPQCRAPMWSVRVEWENSAEDTHIFQCPRCEHSHDIVFPQKRKLVQRR
jgi:hypothetical protein